LFWSKRFVPAIPLPEGGELTTLDDARTYILDLAEEAQQLTTWQNATEALLLVGQHGGPEMFARIGIMKALNPNVVPKSDPSRKETHSGKRKLKRDMC
jgi:hypothetical protein